MPYCNRKARARMWADARRETRRWGDSRQQCRLQVGNGPCLGGMIPERPVMKNRIVVALVLAVVMGSTPLAYAEPGTPPERGWNHDRSESGPRSDPRDRGYRGDHRDRYDRYDRYGPRGRGVGANHNYYRGDRLPSRYRQRSHVVNDWRGHRLSAPPRGYHWVQNGPDYVLVAIATGIIAQILLNH